MAARALIIGAALTGGALAVGGALAPPAHPAAALAVGALAIGLALHGLGRVAGWLVADHDAPAALAIAWGLALWVAIGGGLAALGGFDAGAQRALALAGIALSASWLVRRAEVLAAAARTWRPDRGTLVTAVVAGWVAIHALGAAGPRATFVDGDGDVLGPLTRLAQTGALPDGAHAAGLGGHPIALALTGLLGDARACGAIDGGLGLALAVALAFAALPRTPVRPYSAAIVAAIMLGLPALPPPLAPRWLAVALALATVAALRRPRAGGLAPLTAAALAALGAGGLGLAAVVIATRPTRRARLLGLALAAAVLAGLALTAHPLIARGLPARAGAGVAAGLVLWSLSSLATRAHGDRALAIASAALPAAVAAALVFAPSLRAGALAAVPLALAALLVLLTEASAAPARSPLALTAAFAAVMALAGLRFAIGVPPRSWGDREADVIDAARAHLHAAARAPSEAAAYRAAQQAIPPGAVVGVRVDHADLLDYRRHRVIDLAAAGPVAPALDYVILSDLTVVELRP